MRKTTLYLNIFLFIIVALMAVNSFSVRGHELIQRAWAAACGITNVCGSGTVSYLARFAAGANPSSTIESSIIYDNGTNVGIGTTMPVSKLDVRGNITLDRNRFIYFGLEGTGEYINENPAGTINLYSGSQLKIKLPNDGTTMSLMPNGGNVGIGVTTPNAKLHISGNINLGGELDPAENQGDNWITWGKRADNIPYYNIRTQYKNYTNAIGIVSPYSRLQLNWHTGIELGGHPNYGGVRFFDNSPSIGSQIAAIGDGGYTYFNQNVGIGTTVPGSKLHVVGSAFFDQGSACCGIHFRQEGVRLRVGAAWGIPGLYSEDDQDIVLGMAPGRKAFVGTAGNFMTVQGNGNVGIGTTAPNAKLDVNGAIRLTPGAPTGTLVNGMMWMVP